MREPPTTPVRELDDDRTVIDSVRSGGTNTAFAGPATCSSRPEETFAPQGATKRVSRGLRGLFVGIRQHGRVATNAALVVAAVIGLGTAAHQHWRASDTLRILLAELKAERRASLADSAGSAPQRFATPHLVAPGPDDRVTPIDREGAEVRGANLLVAHDLEAALSHYRELARLLPTEPVFRELIAILDAKLDCKSFSDVEHRTCP